MKTVWEGGKGGCRGVKNKDGEVVIEADGVRERWREYFSQLLNVRNEKEAVITALGMDGGMDGRVVGERSISREEVKVALDKIKLGKTPGKDGVCREMLKYGVVAK